MRCSAAWLALRWARGRLVAATHLGGFAAGLCLGRVVNAAAKRTAQIVGGMTQAQVRAGVTRALEAARNSPRP